MAWDSVPSFLEAARVARLFPADKLEALAASHTADWTFRNLAECDELSEALTVYQTERLSLERPDDVLIAGYPILAELGPCPDGMAYRAEHPILRHEVVLRRLVAEAVGLESARTRFVRRAHAASVVSHPNLLELIDAVEEPNGTIIVTLAAFDGGDLQSLTEDIGPMPTPLAIHYVHSAGQALAAAHARGIVHGDVGPGRLLVGPLAPMSKLRPDGTPKMRPSSNAVLKLSELGLVSVGENQSPADDVCGLARTLFFLLTARMPTTPVEVEQLKALRPDVPSVVVVVLSAATAEDPQARPTLDDFLHALKAASAVVAEPTAANSASLADLVDAALDAKSGIHGPKRSEFSILLPFEDVDSIVDSAADSLPVVPYGGRVAGLAELSWEQADALDYVPEAYADEHPEALPYDGDARSRRIAEKPARGKIWLWIGLGLGLQVFAVLLWVVYITQPFSGSGGPTPATTPKKAR